MSHSSEVHLRVQLVAAVIAESPKMALQAADLAGVEHEAAPHGACLGADREDLYAPKTVHAGYPAATEQGDSEATFLTAAVRADSTYSTTMEHNQPVEPHTTVALWEPAKLTLYDWTQSVRSVRAVRGPGLRSRHRAGPSRLASHWGRLRLERRAARS